MPSHPLLTAWLRSEKYMWFMLSAADSLENTKFKNDLRKRNKSGGIKDMATPGLNHLPAGLQTRSLLSRSRPLPGSLGTT